MSLEWSDNIMKNLFSTVVLALTLGLSVISGAETYESHQTSYRYDIAGRLVGEISVANDHGDGVSYIASRSNYDSTTGLLSSTESGYLTSWKDSSVAPANWGASFVVQSRQDYAYNSIGLVVSITQYAGASIASKTEYAYDAHGRELCVAIRMQPTASSNDACTIVSGGTNSDRITKYEYNGDNPNPVKIYKAYGTELQQVYREASYQGMSSRPNYVIDANGNKTSYSYGDAGRLTMVCYPSPVVGAGAENCNDFESFTYDNNGNVLTHRKRNGQTISYVYDGRNRTITKNLPGTSNDVYYEYDNFGNELYARYASRSGAGITRQFSGFSELEWERVNTDGVTRELSYGYDARGNRTSLTHKDGVVVQYTYDEMDRVDEIGLPNYANPIQMDYDRSARPEALTFASQINISLSYDQVNRLQSLQHNFSGSTYDSLISFGRNAAGQITSKSFSNSLFSDNSNVEEPTQYSVNGLNQYTSVDSGVVTHDNMGNLTSMAGANYTYDLENRLVSASGNNSATIAYDPAGRISKLTINGTTTYFHYDGHALVAELNSSGSVLKRYVHNVGVDRPLVEYVNGSTSSSSIRFLATNDLGSVIAKVNTSGSVTDVNTYSAFGIPSNESFGRFGYTGQLYFEDLGLYHYKARVYNPLIGRFLQTDPIGYDDGLNWYAYVGNDPVNAVDPTGNFGVHIHAWISFTAARASGFSLWQSIKVAYRAVQFDFEAGSQDANKKAVAGHAMSVRGQSPAEASKNHVGLIAYATKTGDFGKASHAIQDSFAEGHSGFAVWSGGFWDEGIMNGLRHLWHDLFPSSDSIDAAYNATRENLSSASGRKQITPPSKPGSSNISDEGMSSGIWRICSGMGAERGGCRDG